VALAHLALSITKNKFYGNLMVAVFFVCDKKIFLI